MIGAFLFSILAGQKKVLVKPYGFFVLTTMPAGPHDLHYELKCKNYFKHNSTLQGT